MKTAKTQDVNRVKRLTALLLQEYGLPKLGNKRSPLDELVFILLSERTDEKKYRKAYANLKATFGSWNAVRMAHLADIRKAIDSAGMGRRRAKLIRDMLRSIVARHGKLTLSWLKGMEPDDAERALVALPGVGKKAARCVLLYCFDMPVLPVDIHTFRLGVRLGLVSRRLSYDAAHVALQKTVPAESRHGFHVAAVAHGRTRCHAIDPRCDGCCLRRSCSHVRAEKPLPVAVRPKPLAVDLFAGAGGMSVGFEEAGFTIVQAVEEDPRVATTYRHNHRNTDVVEDDIRTVDPKALMRKLALRPGDLTAIIGGPPCQGFSESNRRTRTLDNPRNHLYQQFLDVVDSMRPAWFVLENVAGLRTLGGGEVLQAIIGGSREFGYKAECRELNSAEFGVPQVRRRVFVIGNRLGIPIPLLEATHGPEKQRFVSVWEAIGDLPLLRNGDEIDVLPYRTDATPTTYQVMMRSRTNGVVQGNLVTCSADYVLQRYKCIKPGKNWEAIPHKLLRNYKDYTRCHTGIYFRLKRNEPSKVIGNFRKNMLIHPTQNRGLSVREAARLQSFPDSYEFLGSIGFQQQQVADAVPPLLAAAVARAILRADRRR